MSASQDQAEEHLLDLLGEAVLALGTAPESDVELLRLAAAGERAATRLLREAVTSARSHGHSWATIGTELGMSKQAAQQRFGRPSAQHSTGPTPEDDGVTERRALGPVTALTEMAELEAAGRQGWHTVGAGMLRHDMVRTSTQWEHRRAIWVKAPRSYEVDGWQIGCKAFPWIYLIRDTGLPAEG